MATREEKHNKINAEPKKLSDERQLSYEELEQVVGGYRIVPAGENDAGHINKLTTPILQTHFKIKQ